MLSIRQSLSTVMNNNMIYVVVFVLLCVLVSPSASTTTKATPAFVPSSSHHSAFLSLNRSNKGCHHQFGEESGSKASSHLDSTRRSAADNVPHLPRALPSPSRSSRFHNTRLRIRKDANSSDDEGGGDDEATAVGSGSKRSKNGEKLWNKLRSSKGSRISINGEKYWKKAQIFFKDFEPKGRKKKNGKTSGGINGDINGESTSASAKGKSFEDRMRSFFQEPQLNLRIKKKNKKDDERPKQTGDSKEVTSSPVPSTSKTITATKSLDDKIKSFFKQFQPKGSKNNHSVDPKASITTNDDIGGGGAASAAVSSTEITDALSDEEVEARDERERQQMSKGKVPPGTRWAASHPSIDLSGTWKPVASEEFKKEYDRYLSNCGEGVWFRKAFLAAIPIGKEVYEQTHNGRELSITGVTPFTNWKRTLITSGCDLDHGNYDVTTVSFKDPDGDTVNVEAYWTDNGTKHKSFLRGKSRVFDGYFESTRYISPDNKDVLFCEATFHPPVEKSNPSKFKQDTVVWTFDRVE